MINNIEFKLEDDESLFGIFFENGKLKVDEINGNQELKLLYSRANLIHITTHIFSEFEQSDAVIDLLILEANLGFEFALGVYESVIRYLDRDFKNLINLKRINELWDSKYLG